MRLFRRNKKDDAAAKSGETSGSKGTPEAEGAPLSAASEEAASESGAPSPEAGASEAPAGSGDSGAGVAEAGTSAAGEPSSASAPGADEETPKDVEPPREPLRERELTPLEESIVGKLKTIYDPEIPVDIFELGLVYDVSYDATGQTRVKMTLTSPACPVAGSLPGDVERRVQEVPGVTKCDVDLVWDPPWNPTMMSEAARLTLNF